ncbi:MAG: hypothetical protein EXS10_05670 [Phycisphaerales bacterium]|nr:hypothetical protein [Phycisphaerales bacterium]
MHAVERFLNNPKVRRYARPVGLVVGLLLMACAVVFAVLKRAQLAEAMAELRDPPPETVALMLGCVFVGIMLTGLLFHVLIVRFARVPLWEMQALIASTTLANYLPLKPGLIGRVAYHKVRHGIAPVQSARTLLEAMGLTFAAALTAVSLLWVCQSLDLPAELVFIAPLLALFGRFFPKGRTLALGFVIRSAEIFLWALRYWCAFRLIGSPVSYESALVLATASCLTTLVPFISNGLGLREWVVGLLTPMLAGATMEAGIVAELVNRTAELVVVIPCGIAGAIVLAKCKGLVVPTAPATEAV